MAKNNDNEQTLFKIKNSPIGIMQIASVVFFVGNLYMATQLFPLIRNIDSLTQRVSALEATDDTRAGNTTNIAIVQEQIAGMREDIQDLKVDVRAILNKLE